MSLVVSHLQTNAAAEVGRCHRCARAGRGPPSSASCSRTPDKSSYSTPVTQSAVVKSWSLMRFQTPITETSLRQAHTLHQTTPRLFSQRAHTPSSARRAATYTWLLSTGATWVVLRATSSSAARSSSVRDKFGRIWISVLPHDLHAASTEQWR